MKGLKKEHTKHKLQALTNVKQRIKGFNYILTTKHSIN